MLLASTAACSDDDAVDSDEEARRAYLGLDESIAKSLTLGFAGFNAASSANIPPQMTAGILGGTLLITGQVDQGSSDNKGMRLKVGMVDYTDGTVVIEGEDEEINITYDTDADVTLQPALTLSLKNIPTGTLEGTLIGTYQMDGDIIGETTLNLTFAGTLQDSGGMVIRAPGTTTVTGTVTSGEGTYNVDLTL
ncbi:MAG: hypothetical protein H0T79_12435 [Deltaproteobacteria bacterium]|nr:hypothetical protein [Deltaproteobacteria bacterium]